MYIPIKASFFLGQEGWENDHVRVADAKLFFWRSRSGLEFDFIIYGQEGLYAIEVKNSIIIGQGDLRGLTEFGKDHPESRRIMLYRGEEQLERNTIWIISVSKFLKLLAPNRSIEDLLDR